MASSWLALALTPGLAPAVALRAAEGVGGAASLRTASIAERVEAGIPRRAAEALDAAARLAEEEAARVAGLGGRVVEWSAPEYPPLLRTIPDPPLALLVAGDLTALAAPALAVVGARRASAHGRGLAEQIGRDLATAGLVVVSGLATGIDAAAHTGALDAPGRTIAVMATGLDAVYPAWHRPLADRIREAGALVTEYPARTPAFPSNFPRRNRIVSGIASGVIVVEAARRSGSLVTARLALEQNRLVFAVPGRVGSALAEGTNGLLRVGAIPSRSADDVLEDVAPQLLPDLESARRAHAAAELSAEEREVVNALRHGVSQLEGLQKHTGIVTPRLSEVLLALEIRGLVAQTAGKRFRLRAA